MGVPVLFTDSGSTSELTVVPFPGLFLEDELYLNDDLYLDEGPVLQFYAVGPTVTAFGVTVSVDPVAVTFSATVPSINVTDVVVAVVPAPVQFLPTAVGLAGQDLVVSVAAALVTFDATVPETSGGQLLILVPSVRELPPLRLHHTIVTPSGKHFRWAEDEPNPANVPTAVRFSDTMPGGFETADATLPRKPGQDSLDLERLSTWTIRGAGGEPAWEGRIERAPRSSGDEVSVSPSGVGYQAHLDDDKSVRMIYIDRDLGRWQGISATRSAGAGTSFNPINDGSAVADTTTGLPAIRLELSGHLPGPTGAFAESWYDAGPGAKVASLLVASTRVQNATNMLGAIYGADNDVAAGLVNGTSVANNVALPVTFVGLPLPKRWLVLQLIEQIGAYTADELERWRDFHDIAVIGDHGLLGNGFGYRASDIVAHAVGRWTKLNYSAGPDGSIRPSGFFIPHLVFAEATTTSEVVRQATRFGLQDWAVWEDQTFWWHDRGARGRKWRTRVGPAQLSETGQSADRLWNSVLVQYQDVDGTTKTVGPPGSGTDTEDVLLQDTDPTNPANAAGITRRDLLQMGTSTPAAATEIGRRFLEESKLLDGSGQARVVGHVEDVHGVVYPYWAPRAGDTMVFIDAADTSERRIVRTEKDHGSRICSVDLDAPPQGLEALLERLGVVLVPLGIN